MIKNAGPPRLGAGRRCGLLADGLGGSCYRMVGGCLPFWVPEMQGGRARRRGDGLLGMDGAGNDPAAIWRYLISH